MNHNPLPLYPVIYQLHSFIDPRARITTSIADLKSPINPLATHDHNPAIQPLQENQNVPSKFQPQPTWGRSECVLGQSNYSQKSIAKIALKRTVFFS